MKFSVCLRAAVALSVAALAAAQEEQITESLDTVTQEDALTRLNTQPCSCDCCQVIRNPPGEQIVDANGTKLQFTCSYPFAGAASAQSEACGATCYAEPSDQEKTLFSVKGATDTQRFCNFYCRPTYGAPGSGCMRLNNAEMSIVAVGSGNGKKVHWATGRLNTTGDKELSSDVINDMTQQAKATLEQAKQAADAAALDQDVVYDMRKIIGERLRAEAGAHVARGFAAAQHVVANEYGAKRAMMLTKKVSTALRGWDQKIATDVFDTRSSTRDAKDAATAARGMYREVRKTYQEIINSAEEMAVAEIKKQTKAAAKREAEAQVVLQGWDKPANYAKTLAVKAADPYLKQMMDAITRQSEYESYAQGLLGQAKGAKASAQALQSHVNAELAQGNRIQAAKDENKVQGLIAKSKGLEAEAHKFWNVADAARKVIPEWQIAGTNAAWRTAWEFNLALTTAPPEDQ